MKKLCLVLFCIFTVHVVFSGSGKALPYPEAMLFRQGLNQCGPCSMMAVIYIKTGKTVDFKKIDREIPGRKPNALTYPEGMISYFKKFGISAAAVSKGNESPELKMKWLEDQINKGNPIIILNKTKDGVLHWFTILGYSDKAYMIYDSYQDARKDGVLTLDKNGKDPGNINMAKDAFLALWASVVVDGHNSIAIEIK